MQYTNIYQSPIGEILLVCDNKGLTGLWIKGAKYYADGLSDKYIEESTPILESAKKWLDIYFSGTKPEFIPPLHLIGSDFQVSGMEYSSENSIWTHNDIQQYSKRNCKTKQSFRNVRASCRRRCRTQ